MSQEPDPMGGLPLGANEIETFAVSGCGGTTCDKLWSAPLPASTLNGILGGGVLFVRVNDQVWVFDAHGCGAATCSKLATLATPPGAVPQSIGGGKLYVTYTEGGVNKLMALAPG